MTSSLKLKIFTATLIVISFSLIAYSSGSSLKKIMISYSILIISSVIATLAGSVWAKGGFWQRQLKAIKIALPMSALVFLLGYFYITIEAMI